MISKVFNVFKGIKRKYYTFRVKRVSKSCGNDLTVNNFTSSCGNNCTTSNGSATFTVGSTISVPGGSSVGNYIGTYPVSVTY